MTKEEAKKYCIEKGITPYDKYNEVDIMKSYFDGRDAQEEDNEQMMCKFAEWMDKQMYCLHENSHWYNQDDLDAKLTTQELLTIFKQSLKQ